MRSHLLKAVVLCAVGWLMGAGAMSVEACTGIRIRPTDGSVVYARSMEFAADFHSNVVVIPREKQYVGTAPGEKPGLHWTTKYAAVGANAYDQPVIIDGLNEKGLAVGIFYFPGYAKYQDVKPADAERAVAPWELPTLLLGTCANVKEAVAAAERVRVGDAVQPDLGYAPPMHYIVHDAQGQCVVLEYVGSEATAHGAGKEGDRSMFSAKVFRAPNADRPKNGPVPQPPREQLRGELKVYDDPLGVVTNSPAFDWHVTNLCNYVNLTVTNVPPVAMSGIKLSGFGQGSGMLGLPGDFTPPSRFVRAVAFSQSALPVETADEGVLQAFHILNQFDIPKGAARGEEHGHEVADCTLWTSASDLKNLRYYFHTFESRRIRMVDLREVGLDGKQVKTVPMSGKEVIEDLSGDAK